MSAQFCPVWQFFVLVSRDKNGCWIQFVLGLIMVAGFYPRTNNGCYILS